MSVLPDYQPLITYDAHNRAVCFDHRLQVCGICCVDYRGTGRRSDDEDEERVVVLGTGLNRFIPQWDEQLLGPANARQIETNYAAPPKALTPDQLNTHYCGECQLTWMKGAAGVEAVRNHPFHHTYHTHTSFFRSLVVFTDGACPYNGTSSVVNASIGVYFGPQSRYNVSKRLNSGGIPTNNIAAIGAAIEALRQVLQIVEPARRRLIRDEFPWIREDQIRGDARFRLIVATDSSYVIDCMSRHISRWSMVDGIYRNEQGVPVQNSAGFEKLTHGVEELSNVGVQVAWYHVPRRFNQEADELARSALVSMSRGSISN